MIKTPVTIAYGDGIGPEIMKATMRVLTEANAAIEPEIIEIGESVYSKGHRYGITKEGLDSINRTKVFLKAPISASKKVNHLSLDHLLRKVLDIYINVRPIIALSPFLPTHHPDTNVVVIREFSEDIYADIEYRQTQDEYQCLKPMTRSGCERVIRYAFEYAKTFNRKKVSCLTKDNILYLTDGLFREVFNEIGEQYSEIEKEHFLVDEGTAMVANYPEKFDVIVSQNLYADIVADVAAELVSSISLYGSANIGEGVVMFEASHGPATRLAGQRVANPSGLIHAAVQMLIHIGQADIATTIENAWLKTIEDGYHTADIYSMDYSEKKLTTDEFAEAIIERFGQEPSELQAVHYEFPQQEDNAIKKIDRKTTIAKQKKQLVGVDIFIDLPVCGPTSLAVSLNSFLQTNKLKLHSIKNRGFTVWPDEFLRTDKYCADCWRCRFQGEKDFKKKITIDDVLELCKQLNQNGMDVLQMINLYSFDGKIAFS